MTFSLVEVAAANFRSDETTDKLNSDFMIYLGVKARYMPARLAIARSLAVSAVPEPLPEGHEPGKTIKGDTLFGTSSTLGAWLALIVERADAAELSLKDLTQLVGAHWARGIRLLESEWLQSEQDVARFIRRLVDSAELPAGNSRGAAAGATGREGYTEGLLEVPIGEVATEVLTGEPVLWRMNGMGGSPHAAIMGGVGSGKTRTAISLLQAISKRARVPMIAFDFKGDLATDTDGNGYHLDRIFGARTIHPPHQPVPLHVLSIRNSDDITLATAAERFRESFARLKGNRLGDRQKDAVFEAALRALRARSPCQLSDIRDALRLVYEEREMREDGAVSTLNDLCRFPLFQPIQRPEDFFTQSWVIRLTPDVTESSRGIVVNLILDALDQHLNSLADAPTSADGSRSLRVLCVIDEAHRILGTKLPSLSSLIRMSRSKGGSIFLISQSPDDFSGEDDDFLNEMGLVTAFGTNARQTAANRILGRGANLSSLQMGQCYAKRRGDQSARRVQAWQAGP